MEIKQLIRKITQYKESVSQDDPLENFRVITEEDLADVDRDLFEERAAIIQFDGRFTQDQANYIALNDPAVSRSILENRRKKLFKPRAGTTASKEFVRENVLEKINELKKTSTSINNKSSLFSNNRKSVEPKTVGSSTVPSSLMSVFRKNKYGDHKDSRLPSPLDVEIGDYSNIPF